MNVSAFEKCSNCGACVNLCPHGAITVDQSGLFYKPVVDETKCTHCGLCSSRCPVNGQTESFEPVYACAGWHKSPRVVLESSSGGVFHGLAEDIIAQGGVAFGAAYSEDLRAVIFKSSDEVPLAQLQKSKYVESLVGSAFGQIKSVLASGRKVLFCGTPCQVAGLYAFLGKRPEGLLTCDFACGGLPSHRIYRDYLQGLEEKYHGKAISVDFRPKTHGWRRYAMQIRFQNGRVYNRLGEEDLYLRGFLYGKYTVRKDCLTCKFSDHHAADLTIADFWLNTKLAGPENSDGVSLVLCNTQQGRQEVDRLREQFVLQEMPVAAAAYNHKKTEATPEKLARREVFLRLYEDKGLDACSMYLTDSLKEQLINRIRRILFKSRGRKR